MSETSLYPAVKRLLEAASFDVKGEVKGCDIVAVRAAEGLTLAIVEMKLGFTLPAEKEEPICRAARFEASATPTIIARRSEIFDMSSP